MRGIARIIAVACVATGAAGAASAATVLDAFTLSFGENSISSNDPLTGASGDATFSFADEGEDVRVSVKVTNTTGTTTFGAGATSATLTGFGFDLLTGDMVAMPNGATLGDALDTFLTGAAFQPFGSLDVAFADNNNFNGGNANDGLKTGAMTTGSFLLDTSRDATGAATAYETAFFSGGLQAGLRFQQVNAGEGSDKLVFVPTTTAPPPPPPPPPSVVPLPAAGVMLLGALGGLGALRRRRG